MSRKSTMVELVEELQNLPSSAELNFMIEEAKAGEYHDYKNEKYICGKVESSQRLRKLGYTELAMRIEKGEFDEEADDDDIVMICADVDETVEGLQAEALKKILGVR